MFALMLSPRTSEAESHLEALLQSSAAAGLPLQRTRNGRALAVFAEAAPAVDLALLAVRSGWSAGLGTGVASAAGEPALRESAVLPENAALRESAARWEGAAVSAASRALEAAQKAADAEPISVEGPVEALAQEAQAVLRLLAGIITSRTEAEWRVLDLLVPGVRGQQKFVAQELGITTQAVSKAIHRSQWAQEQAARPAAARLLSLADGVLRFWE